MSQDLCFKSVDTLVHRNLCCSSNVTGFVLQICWVSGALKHLLFLCHKICTAICWYSGALKHLLLSKDLCFNPVVSLVSWSICSSNDTRFVLQICWYSGSLKHLLFLWCKICTANLLILWYIEESALLMLQDLYFKSIETLVHWNICCFSNGTRKGLQNCYWSICYISHVRRFVLQICWDPSDTLLMSQDL